MSTPDAPTWYVGTRDGYYVPRRDSARYPVGQGDVFIFDGMPAGWTAAQLVHPTCEVARPGVASLQVVGVHSLGDLKDDVQRALVTAGLREQGGAWTIAMAHTFFLWPWRRGADAAFADFREITLIPKEGVSTATRVATLTHDCRVTFIRRWLYFRFRLLLPFDDVRALEADRIAGDAHFEGPRPAWAPAPTG